MQKGKKFTVLLAVVLVAVLASAAGAAGTAFVMHKKQAKPVQMTVTDGVKKNGYDIVKFGAYPQSRVTDKKLIRELNRLVTDWQSFGYFKESTRDADGGTEDYMRYADVAYAGIRYRAVTMDFYRDSMYMDAPSDDSDAQALKNHGGYRCNTVYWFRFDPLQWRVLDAETGTLLCDCIVDAQPFSTGIRLRDSQNAADDPYYTAYAQEKGETLANDYSVSSIRHWLLEDFKTAAFTNDEIRKLQSPTLANACYHTLTGKSGFERMDGKNIQDAVTLLSYADAVNPRYGFQEDPEAGNPAREAMYTDYAVIQGLFLTQGGAYGEWMLRTPGYTSADICIVGRAPQKGSSFPGYYRNYFHDRDDGPFSVVSPYADVTAQDIGIRPVVYCPQATVGKSAPNGIVSADATAQTVSEPSEETVQAETAAEDEDFLFDEADLEDVFVPDEVPATTQKTQKTTQTVTTTRARTSTRATTRKWYSTAARTTTAVVPTTTGTYNLTVSGDKGVAQVTGGGTYPAGTEVTVHATILFGQTFLGWKSSDSSLLADGTAQSYTFVMPAGNVQLTAVTYVKPTVTVVAGKGVSSVSGDGAYAIGQTVSVKAQILPGYEFAGWKSEADGIVSKQAAYSFEMPEHSVKLTATAVEKGFAVIVKAGTGVASVSGSGQYKPGDKVTVSAVLQPEHTFDQWLGYAVDDPRSASTTFTMPASDVALFAMAK